MAPGNKALAVLNNIPPHDWLAAISGAYVGSEKGMHKKTRTQMRPRQKTNDQTDYFFLRTIITMITTTMMISSRISSQMLREMPPF